MLSEAAPDIRSIVAAIDDALGENVIVTGRLPPEGRDLDLLVSPGQAERLADLLARQGFLPRGREVRPARVATQQWVRFDGCSALAVDLNPIARWHLPSAEERALIAEACPLEGYRNLCRPSPHHALLIMARRLATGTVPPRFSKLTVAAQAEPLAWERAQCRAQAWHVQVALPALRALHELGSSPTRGQRAMARAETVASAGFVGLLERAAREVSAARPQAPAVVGLSGLDGSGKSSQTRALASLLRELDVAVVVEWKPLGHNNSIRAIRRTTKRAIAALRGLDAEQLDRLKRPGQSLIAGANPALLGGRQKPLITQAWATLVCLASAGHYRLVVLRQAGSGRLIIFDRFALDTMAQLRFFYGPEHPFRLQRALIRRLCPAPLGAWLLDVSAEVALGRKAEQYDLEQLRQQEALLREEAPRLGITILDGTRPMPEVCQEIVAELWRRMAR